MAGKNGTMDMFLVNQHEALQLFNQQYGTGIAQQSMSEAGLSREELGQSGLAPERGLSWEEVADSGLAPRNNKGKVGGESGKGDGQGVPTQMGKEGALPKSTSVQEEGGEGVLAPTGQLGPLPQPGTAYRDVPKQTGGENPKVKAKLALPIMTAKCGPAPPPLQLNTYYNHSLEGELMDVDRVAWVPMHKRGGEKKDTGGDGEEWEGDNDEEEDEEVVEVKHEAKKSQGETRK